MSSARPVSMFLSAVCIGVLVLSGPLPWAAGQALRLHGRLVNAGCDARVLSLAEPQPSLKPLKINASLTLEILDHDDACDEAVIPLTAAYIERMSINPETYSGVVTLTYQ